MDDDHVIWIDGGGGEIDLNDRYHYFFLRDRSGVNSLAYTFATSKLPLSEGSSLNGITIESTYVDGVLKVLGDDAADLRARMRDLEERLDPTLGIGQLKIIGSDGDGRKINCYPQGMKSVKDHYSNKEIALSFGAIEDPFWYALEPVAVVIENTISNETFLGNPFLPLRLITSTVYSDQVVNNPGGRYVYPVWTIHGPGEAIILRNLTTGAKIWLPNVALGDDDVLVIDTRSGIKTVELNGNDIFGELNKLSNLWPLVKGDNTIVVQMSSTDLGSSVTLTFTPRYGAA